MKCQLFLCDWSDKTDDLKANHIRSKYIGYVISIGQLF